MSLSVALGLSGLDTSKWTDIGALHRPGAVLFDTLHRYSVLNDIDNCERIQLKKIQKTMPPDCTNNVNEEPIEENKEITIEIDETERNGATTQVPSDDSKKEPEEEEEEDEDEKDAVIFHGRKNILDLASNIRTGWQYKTALLPQDMSVYFANRSQYSRLMGAIPPQHTDVLCDLCGFINPIYD